MEFQNRLYSLRKKAGLSQEGLAGLLGVTRQAVQKWEMGTSRPDMDNLTALAQYFDVTLDYLVLGREASDPQAAPRIVVEKHYYHRFQYEYKSPVTVLGLPLVHICIGLGRAAKGIVAIGDRALGVAAVGGLSCGLFSLGGLSLGLLFSLGGAAAGALALGGAAVGLLSWGGFAAGYLACGGICGGVYAIGGIATASQIAVGSVVSAPLAIGDTFGSSLTCLPADGSVSAAAIRTAIEQAAAGAPGFIRDFLTFMAVHIHAAPLQ